MNRLLLPKGQTVLIDEADYDIVKPYTWHYTNGYVKGKIGVGHKGKSHGVRRASPAVFMHRLLIDASPGWMVDHINGNGVDNRRCNLRLCTKSQNTANGKSFRTKGRTSQYRGVHWLRNENLWRAALTINCRPVVAGRFKSEREAALAYNELAVQYFGSFARLNVVME